MVKALRLSEEQRNFVAGGVAVIAASADDRGRSSVAFALGCLVAPDGRQIRIYLDAGKSTELLSDLTAGGRFAVVICEPSTNRTIQLKGEAPRRQVVRKVDHQRIAAYVDDFVRELRKIGEEEAVVRTLMACDREAVVALEFRPTAAFSQTPGPRAGNPLRP